MLMNNSISIEEVLQLENPTIVDIREYYYYNIGHIIGAISIPYYNLLNNHNHYLTYYNTYYLYCERGEQSKELVEKLKGATYQKA